jgi:hypothetical protein
MRQGRQPSNGSLAQDTAPHRHPQPLLGETRRSNTMVRRIAGPFTDAGLVAGED